MPNINKQEWPIVGVSIPPEWVAKLDAEAARRFLSRSDIIREVIWNGIKDYPEKTNG